MKTALIVEDNPDLRILLKRALQRENYAVELAENGLVAKEKLENGSSPCVIFLDLMMPVMNGSEFLSWKNTSHNFEDIPVVVVTAQPDQSLTGIRLCIRKPVDLSQVLEEAQKACAC